MIVVTNGLITKAESQMQKLGSLQILMLTSSSIASPSMITSTTFVVTDWAPSGCLMLFACLCELRMFLSLYFVLSMQAHHDVIYFTNRALTP